MGIFGWSYPPGCSSVPGDEPVPPCPICGLDPEEDEAKGGCTCKPCPVCEQGGCLEHMEQKTLVALFERHQYIAGCLEMELKCRYDKAPTLCRECGKPMTFQEAQQQEGMPYHSACEADAQRKAEQM